MLRRSVTLLLWTPRGPKVHFTDPAQTPTDCTAAAEACTFCIHAFEHRDQGLEPARLRTLSQGSACSMMGISIAQAHGPMCAAVTDALVFQSAAFILHAELHAMMSVACRTATCIYKSLFCLQVPAQLASLSCCGQYMLQRPEAHCRMQASIQLSASFCLVMWGTLEGLYLNSFLKPWCSAMARTQRDAASKSICRTLQKASVDSETKLRPALMVLTTSTEHAHSVSSSLECTLL